MGDAFSDAKAAKKKAEDYLISKGWQPPAEFGVGWRDPLPPNEKHFFDIAWDMQFRREKEAHEGRQLTDVQELLLINLIEECSEVIQAATKVLRFGDRVIPEGPRAGVGTMNTDVLGAEVDDVRSVLRCLEELPGMEALRADEKRIEVKIARLNKRLAESVEIRMNRNAVSRG